VSEGTLVEKTRAKLPQTNLHNTMANTNVYRSTPKASCCSHEAAGFPGKQSHSISCHFLPHHDSESPNQKPAHHSQHHLLTWQQTLLSSVAGHHALHLICWVLGVGPLDVELLNQQLHSLRLKEGCRAETEHSSSSSSSNSNTRK
jgi:hypothetical protein